MKRKGKAFVNACKHFAKEHIIGTTNFIITSIAIIAGIVFAIIDKEEDNFVVFFALAFITWTVCWGILIIVSLLVVFVDFLITQSGGFKNFSKVDLKEIPKRIKERCLNSLNKFKYKIHTLYEEFKNFYHSELD